MKTLSLADAKAEVCNVPILWTAIESHDINELLHYLVDGILTVDKEHRYAFVVLFIEEYAKYNKKAK